MKYLLDTNVCIRLMNGQAPLLYNRMRQVSVDDLCVSSNTRSEMYFCAAKSRDPIVTRENQRAFLERFKSIVYDDNAAERYGTLRAALSRAGTVIGPNDMLIAASALARGLTLVTHNTREFSRVEGLAIEDWEV
jgi:tRNA(fMet)-specific endonuclease VapC